MAAYFFDSSALVKRYHPEVGTADVNRLFHEENARHFIARLAVVEVQIASTFSRTVGAFRGRPLQRSGMGIFIIIPLRQDRMICHTIAK